MLPVAVEHFFLLTNAKTYSSDWWRLFSRTLTMEVSDRKPSTLTTRGKTVLFILLHFVMVTQIHWNKMLFNSLIAVLVNLLSCTSFHCQNRDFYKLSFTISELSRFSVSNVLFQLQRRDIGPTTFGILSDVFFSSNSCIIYVYIFQCGL